MTRTGAPPTGGIWRWADWIAPVDAAARVTLGEGNTPLVRSARIGPSSGLHNLYFKLEISNPSGSYKDRFAAAAVADMRANGKTRCVATSSGNTGSALAAYCAAAGIRCEIAIVETAPEGKLSQMLAYGAELFRVRGFGPDPEVSRRTFEVIKRLGSAPDAALQISAFAYSPVGMSGVQTIAYELNEQIDRIDHVFSPAGGGGLTLAVARGFEVLQRERAAKVKPRVECVQPAGNDTIATALRTGREPAAVTCTTEVSGLQVPTVIDGFDVVRACRASGGTGHAVTDDEVWWAHARMCREEGIFCEPAGATALAGALKAHAEGLISPDATVVCLVTGSGFKDPPSVQRLVASQTCPLVGLAELERRS